MSDDDERMDRAKRIRQMREGQRSNDEGDGPSPERDDSVEEAGGGPEDAPRETTDESDADDGTDDTGTDAAESDADDGIDQAATDADGGTDDKDLEPTDTDADDETEAEATDADPTTDADERPTQTAEHSTANTDAATRPTRADGATTDDIEEDSMSEHTSTTETDVSSETDDETPDPEAIAQRAAQAAASVSGGGTASDQSPGGEPTPAETAAAVQGASGVDLPDQEQIDAALEAANESIETADEAPTEGGPGAAAVESETTTEESTRVLEFTLGEEHYCIDISLVEEIVKIDTITRVPNTDDYIEGVVDLRGQITTILDPKELLDIDAEGSETLMIVFDPEAFDDQGAIGWIVDEVRQVAPIRESEINDPPVDEDYIHGVVDREDGFVIWTKPEVAIKLATVDADESE